MGYTPPESGSANQRGTIDKAFEALSNVHRYRLLTGLLEQNPQEAIDAPVADDAGTDIGSVQVAMYHNHLPKLDQAGFIRWNRDENQVRKGPEFDTVEKLLEQRDGYVDDNV